MRWCTAFGFLENLGIVTAQLVLQLKQIAAHIWSLGLQQVKIHQNPLNHCIFGIRFALNADH